ncbi:hypothetical protein PVAP13_8NG356102 [Panicum virgatum]|uniref:Uncharacterized protein n=1 Tax=Panicum virgatum TaxID=38727 RepID=A0A8T0P1E2_PANVG|nr:hypothetical protein PVAP13_8NG356102 [Panicum virgatum]
MGLAPGLCSPPSMPASARRHGRPRDGIRRDRPATASARCPASASDAPAGDSTPTSARRHGHPRAELRQDRPAAAPLAAPAALRSASDTPAFDGVRLRGRRRRRREYALAGRPARGRRRRWGRPSEGGRAARGPGSVGGWGQASSIQLASHDRPCMFVTHRQVQIAC